jgi:thiamine biosynthesis protein ThiI
MMYRVAERLAIMYHAEGIVTGEAIGEQASQTLINLRVLSAAVKDFPIHRPLLGFDKHETEEIGRKIGTYGPSSVKAASCGAVPYQPSTKAKLDEIIKAGEKLPIELMIEESIKSIRVFEF